ncbi:hypothetical protein HUO14_08040 [Parasphingorhabdus flavimaris]|jgi:hypothetical protein|uniref:Uncharacterized protein n=1 Tax=Parasphingorhabdus flavimaris TaxID=266812 RepID=A0ABX2N2D2_9SPHN|nr:hypothetical protein [Parasphingorhabdus flavimaris]NVD27850.1 hypothetical protein [Parasphingorhabdus flavimaris]|tara:strand:+ start:8777 stop:9322 length:546 start_codon:yes stop_codon:yes gene_type:complete
MQLRQSSSSVQNIWAGVLASSSVLGSLALACIFPFAAIATLLAATLPFRKAAVWMGAVWFANQLVGYLILGYPQTANSFGHGLAMGATAMATLFVAKTVLDMRSDRSFVTLGLAFVAAFAAYEALLLLAATFLGGVQNFMPSIVWMVAQNDILWFAGLAILYMVLDGTLFERIGKHANPLG